jgi:insertion element IS1 protein InsB
VPDTDCAKNTFILSYKSQGRLPGIAGKIVDMAMNASGIRDTARVLGISPTTVIGKLKGQEPKLAQVNTAFLRSLCPKRAQVRIARVEGDEMWSFVGSKSGQYWLWHAIDHHSGKVLAYVLAAARTRSTSN